MKFLLLFCALTSLIVSCTNTKQSTQAGITFDKQGHRGSRGLMPENTIAGMLKAIDLGVNTVEMDVVISKDKKVVVSHDPHFHENITTLPNGKTLTKNEAATHLLYEMNYDSIRKYDVGLKVHPDFPKQEKIASFKPLLNELLAATEQYTKQKGRALFYNIEIKSKLENDGKKHPPIGEFIDLVVSVIKSSGIVNRVIVQSFDPRGLQEIHRRYPEINTALLIEGTDKRTLEEQLQNLGYIPKTYSPHFSLVTPALIQQCHQKGMKVIPWTVNQLDQIKRLKEMGVDGIITDYPELFNQL